jgi:hypothetical protein
VVSADQRAGNGFTAENTEYAERIVGDPGVARPPGNSINTEDAELAEGAECGGKNFLMRIPCYPAHTSPGLQGHSSTENNSTSETPRFAAFRGALAEFSAFSAPSAVNRSER